MLKDSDTPKEPPSERAKRKWNNHLFRQRFLEERDRKPKEVNVDGLPPDPADVIANEDRLSGRVKRLETKFAKEIRKMLKGHIDKNVMLYVATLAHQKRRLLKEKLRRLEAAHQSQGG